jgi:hypothetical protein
MSRRLSHAELLASQQIVAPPRPRACTDRGFELPTGIYVAWRRCSRLRRGAELRLPQSGDGSAVRVFVAFIATFFVVPGVWARMKPEDSRTPALDWSSFMAKGIDTATGHSSGREATVLALLLPFLILCWALAVAVIAALV